MVSRKYAHKIPFIVKINHNEILTYPNQYDQVMYGSVEGLEPGVVAVGATIYFGSEQTNRQLQEVASAFERAHELGMATILWCYLRNSAFKRRKKITMWPQTSPGRPTTWAITYTGRHYQTKLPENNGGTRPEHRGSSYGKFDEKIYTQLSSGPSYRLCRYQVINCYMGRAGLINSGVPPPVPTTLAEAVKTAVINKR